MQSNQSRHHRRAKTNGGSNEPPNTIRVDHRKHEAFHLLFGTLSVYQIAEILNETWIDPDFKLIVLPRQKDEYY